MYLFNVGLQICVKKRGHCCIFCGQSEKVDYFLINCEEEVQVFSCAV